MPEYQLKISPEAKSDLAATYKWMRNIAGRVVADNFVKRLRLFLHEMREFPHRGSIHSNFGDGLRVIGFEKSASIAFCVVEETKSLVVLRILYRGADWRSEFRDE